MISSNRLDYIVDKITIQKFVSVEQLSQSLSVSGETIRRDLKYLETKGIVNRVYGGAYLSGARGSDVSVQVRKSIMLQSKEQIAVLSAGLIKPDDTIFLDSSTTSLEIAKRLTGMPVTVITHSLLIINYLSEAKNIRLIALGGELDMVNMCFSGKITLENMQGLYARKCFISCRTLSEDYGVMDSNEQISQVRSTAAQNCSRRYLVIDHTKFGQTSLYKISGLDRLDAIITDRKPDEHWLEIFSQYGIEVLYPGQSNGETDK